MAFEWIGERNYLKELSGGKVASDRGRKRGANFTSLDFAFRFRRTDGRIQIVAGEWKYTENYTGKDLRISRSGTDRLCIYRPFMEQPDCQINLGCVSLGALCFDPFDQLMRQQLLCSSMERHHEMGADIVSLLHVAPAANKNLMDRVTSPELKSVGSDIHRIWAKLVSSERFSGVYTVDLPAFGMSIRSCAGVGYLYATALRKHAVNSPFYNRCLGTFPAWAADCCGGPCQSPLFGDFQVRMTGEHTEVGVVVQNGHIGANGDRADDTIDQLANGLPFPPAEAVKSGCVVIIRRSRGKDGHTGEQSGGGSKDAVRHAHRRALPSERHRRPQSRCRAAHRHDCRPRTRCREETRPMRTYRSESRRSAGPHLVEVAVPAGPAKPSGFIDAEGLRRKGSKRKVDRLALCFQTVTAHDLRARLIVDIHIGA